MPYTNIVFVKLEKRLLNDHRWYMMSERSQLNFIRFILISAETNNKIPKNLKAIKLAMKTDQDETEISESIKEIKINFPKFKENKYFYYFDDFDEKTNWVKRGNSEGIPKELPRNSEGSPRVRVRSKEDKDKEKSKSKSKTSQPYVVENLPSLPSLPLQNFNGNGVSFNDDDSKEETKEKIDHMFKVYCNIPNPEKSTVTRVYNIIAKCPVPAVARSTVIQSFRNFFHLPDEKRNIPYLCSAIQGKINDELILYRERIAEKEKHNEKVIALDEDASRVIGSLVNKFGGQQL